MLLRFVVDEVEKLCCRLAGVGRRLLRSELFLSQSGPQPRSST
jgi:hypothetical protein